MNDFHHPAQPLRAPHADPLGRFRGAPLNGKRRAKYSMVVVLILVMLGVVPFLIDASLPRPQSPQMTTDDAYTSFVNTDTDWPLRFSFLEECDVVRDPIAFYYAQFDCGDVDVRVMGMPQVDKDLPAMALAMNRSIRAMEKAQVDDLSPHEVTRNMESTHHQLLESTGVDTILMTDPFQLGWISSNGAHGGFTMNYAVGFFRGHNSTGSNQGSLVTVDVSTKPLARGSGPGDAVLMDTALSYAMTIVESAHTTSGADDSESKGVSNV
ncbi:hypothetical protein [Corynebacterium anserum]|uniref:Uncharacterized protein n=1 Tax=Corynebacterium anserum TaxID=2684406 RepID=A0A7G7YLJ5_9CORY|nr:hypothetical protein [Corynebacterium anserum]MBC2682596.1 hypothetical protein [Corynebacterium anserum]QNH95365.1 hypothetical protein GP473_00400 [Corynebacterium anserum]